MSCGGGCGAGGKSSPRRTPGSPSHRPVQLAVERSPRPAPQEVFGNNYAEVTLVVVDQLENDYVNHGMGNDYVVKGYQYAAYGNLRMPTPGRATTPGPYGYPSQFESFGAQNEYNMSWMPKDINLSELLEQTSGTTPSSRFRSMEKNSNHTPSQPGPSNVPQPSLLQQTGLVDESNAGLDEERRESLMEWFDRSVEKEMKKHKDTGSPSASYTPQQDLPEVELEYSKATLDRITDASASQLEMISDLKKQPVTDLADAVDKLAKAEAMCKFAGAVKAAEAAAQRAPPELAEEAAASGARGYVTDIQVTQIQEELPGIRPIEVVGYIGVTKPKNPVRKK